MSRAYCKKLRDCLRSCRSDSGQAQAEYVIALSLVLVATLALAGLVAYFNGSGEEGSRHTEKTFRHAPYTLPYRNGLSGQWLKDILIH